MQHLLAPFRVRHAAVATALATAGAQDGRFVFTRSVLGDATLTYSELLAGDFDVRFEPLVFSGFNASPTGSLRVARTGDTVTMEHAVSGGPFVALGTGSSTRGLNAHLVAYRFGYIGVPPTFAVDNFSLDASSVATVPEPAAAVLEIGALAVERNARSDSRIGASAPHRVLRISHRLAVRTRHGSCGVAKTMRAPRRPVWNLVREAWHDQKEHVRQAGRRRRRPRLRRRSCRGSPRSSLSSS